ncbi:MAG TPA: NPCBM/NEW2 domain-containing protein, partial [Planctomycetota bacterium]|nr:NPCBM/NEW2 domain-containing protein [Planctomycetota bacterium]
RDVGPGQRPLTLGERRYRRGLFVVPPRSLVFELPRTFDRLIGEVGMPQAPLGRARLRILGDDRVLLEQVELRSDGRVLPLMVEVGKAKRLTIEVEVGPELDSGSRVVFGDLRLIAD